MKIAITVSNNKGLDSEIDSRFGRARYFALIDPETEEIEIEKNSAASAASGAGVAAAQQVVDLGADAVISGNFGPKAFSSLRAGGLELYTLNDGTVKDAIASYNQG
ncbi:MAG: NifB/NifX family molybdenum-iron cluster-binding protein [Bacillota bacterium]